MCGAHTQAPPSAIHLHQVMRRFPQGVVQEVCEMVGAYRDPLGRWIKEREQAEQVVGRGREWLVHECSIADGESVRQGFEWLANACHGEKK